MSCYLFRFSYESSKNKKPRYFVHEKGGESTRINEITKVEEEARIASLCRRYCALALDKWGHVRRQKKLRNQCVAHTVLPTTGGPLRCTMLEASFLIILGSRAGGIYCQNHSFAGHIALY